MGYSQNDKKIVQNRPRNIRKIEESCRHTKKGQRALKALYVVHSLKMIDRMCSTNFGKLRLGMRNVVLFKVW